MEFMNLTNTKRWKEFEDWYDKQNFLYSIRSGSDNIPDFEELDFEFQEGVYRKFIESLVDGDNERLYLLEMENFPRVFRLNGSRYIGGITKPFNTFQELVTWFFNEV